MRENVLSPAILETAGKTVAKVAETLGKDYLIHKAIDRWVKPIIIVSVIVFIGLVSLTMRIIEMIRNTDVEKVINDHPVTTLVVAIWLLLFVWLKTESYIKK